jgi:hypothetical protein
MRLSICLCMSLCEWKGGWGYMSWFYTWLMWLEIEGDDGIGASICKILYTRPGPS